MSRYGYYIVFDGIATKLGTHTATQLGLSAPYANVIASGSMSFDKQTLDRALMLVKLGGFSFDVQRTPVTEAIFQSKGGVEDSLNAKVDEDDTTIVLKSGANTYDDASQVYVGRETITLGVGTAGSYPFSSRGAKGSDATQHRPGATVSSVPRFWRGRRAVCHQVDLITGDDVEFAAGYITKDVSLTTQGIFSFVCQGIAHKLNRQLLSGFNEVKVTSNPTLGSVLFAGLGEYDAFTFEVEDARQIATSSTSGVGFVKIKAGEAWGIYRVREGEIDVSTNQVTIAILDLLYGTLALSFSSLRDQDISIRQVQYLRDDISRIAVQLLLSSRGDLTNDPAWDVLPGRAPDYSTATDLTRKSVGAALPPSWVDTASFGKMRDVTVSVLIDEPIGVFEFIKNELLWRAGGVLYATPGGAISFKRSEGFAIRSNLTAFDAYDDGLNPFEIHEAESRLIARALLECNYIPEVGFTTKMPVTWAATEEEASDNSPEIKVASKSLWVGPVRQGSGPVSPEPFVSLALNFDRQRARTLYGGRLLKFRVGPSDANRFPILSRHSVSNEASADLRGGVLSGMGVEVVGRKFNTKTGQTEVEAEEIQRDRLLAPSAMVLSWNAGTLELTLDTASTTLGNGTIFDADPANDFVEAGDVHIFDATDAFQTHEKEQIRGIISGNVIELVSAPSGFIPAGGDLVVMALDSDKGDLNAEGADVLDHGFAADSDFVIGAGTGYEEPGPRLA